MDNESLQEQARGAVREFLENKLHPDGLEKRIAGLWVENQREFDGDLGAIYEMVTDWDMKCAEEELRALLTKMSGTWT